jgi:para-aminobenzoate synthetase component 1
MLSGYKLPLIEELQNTLPPNILFEFFQNQLYCFFLDSAMDQQKLGRYSLMGSQPFLIFKSQGDTNTVIQDGEVTIEVGNPFDVLKRYLDTYRLDSPPTTVPCTGGAVGYFSYDLCHFIEQLPSRSKNDLCLPECCLGFYDLILIFDNFFKRTFIVSTGFPEIEEKTRIAKARERLDKLKNEIEHYKPVKHFVGLKKYPEAKNISLTVNFTHDEYLRAVSKARQYIIDGDIFEVNLSQRFESELTSHPYELYCRLRQINPAPFAAYMDFGDISIVSSSPERFLNLNGNRVETRPIKGTIRRGKTPEEDRANANRLLGSLKDRAENMMIVDLERNDLGKVCRFGTVKVTELAILETYPTVFHLTSTVVGQLKEDVNRIDLLKATFPGGSITGAPKIRSMEIIDELEPTRRGLYTGSLGYLSFNGNMDLNIAIRTFLVKDNKVYFQLGGAVVYDSEPESEYQETLDKGRALFRSIGLSEGFDDINY